MNAGAANGHMMMSFSDLAVAMAHLPMSMRHLSGRGNDDALDELDVIDDEELPDGKWE